MDEIEERLALIGALAEDAQAGFEAMLVPFGVRHLDSPRDRCNILFCSFGTFRIRVGHLACGYRILPDFFASVFSPRTADKNTKGFRPYLRRFMGRHRFYNRAGFCVGVFR